MITVLKELGIDAINGSMKRCDAVSKDFPAVKPIQKTSANEKNAKSITIAPSINKTDASRKKELQEKPRDTGHRIQNQRQNGGSAAVNSRSASNTTETSQTVPRKTSNTVEIEK